jgi:hypothetical protein
MLESMLAVFGQSYFNESVLRVHILQWNTVVGDTAQICVDHPLTLLLIVSPTHTMENNSLLLENFQKYWTQALEHIFVKVLVKQEQKTITSRADVKKSTGPDQLSSSHLLRFGVVEPGFDTLRFISTDEKSSALFSLSLDLSISSQFFEQYLTLELELMLCMPQELPFNNKQVSNRHERDIRMLMDRNRHSTSKTMSRTLRQAVVFVQPLQIVQTCHEVDSTYSLVSITFFNKHKSLSLCVEDVALQLSQTKLDAETLLERLSSQLDDSYEAVSCSDPDNESSDHTTISSRFPTTSSVGLLFDSEIISPHQILALGPGQAQRVIFRVSIKPSILQSLPTLSGWCPFGYFSSPMTSRWTIVFNEMAVNGNIDCWSDAAGPILRSEVLWSLGSNSLPTRNSNLLTDLIHFAYGSSTTAYVNLPPKTMIPSSMLTIDIEGPHCVLQNAEFSLKLILSNASSRDWENVKVSTPIIRRDNNE